VFALGLFMVVVAGAELFTGNNLIVMAWADGRVSTGLLLRNWGIVCVANFVGAAGLALLVFASGHAGLNGGAIGTQGGPTGCGQTGDAIFHGLVARCFVQCVGVHGGVDGHGGP
jgi:hypothetical protein